MKQKELQLLVAISENENESIQFYSNKLKGAYCHLLKVSKNLVSYGLIEREKGKYKVLLNLTAKGKKYVGASRLILEINAKNKI